MTVLWGTPVEIERRNRILVALWAYAYEIMDNPLVEDHIFDSKCLEIQPNISTDNPKLDNFFKTQFTPDTGMWIYKHPDIAGLASLYKRRTGQVGKIPTSSIKTNVPITSSAQAAINAGFKTHTQVKLYLSMKGFAVLDDHQWIGGKCFHFKYEGGLVHITDVEENITKTVMCEDFIAGCKKVAI